MNRIILEESERIEDSLYCLTERKSNHILKIIKSNIGDTVKVGLINHSIGNGIVQSIDLVSRNVILFYNSLEGNKNIPQSKLGNIRIFSSIQRPQTVKKIIQLSATCGIQELFFFPADKSESSYLNSSLWSKESLLGEIILGLEQGGRIYSPQITVLKNKYRIQENLISGNRYILDFGGKYLLDPTFSINPGEPLQFVIGPESGLTEDDLAFFLKLQFDRISVSENILRSENALAYLLSQIELLKSRPTGK